MPSRRRVVSIALWGRELSLLWISSNIWHRPSSCGTQLWSIAVVLVLGALLGYLQLQDLPTDDLVADVEEDILDCDWAKLLEVVGPSRLRMLFVAFVSMLRNSSLLESTWVWVGTAQRIRVIPAVTRLIGLSMARVSGGSRSVATRGEDAASTLLYGVLGQRWASALRRDEPVDAVQCSSDGPLDGV